MCCARDRRGGRAAWACNTTERRVTKWRLRAQLAQEKAVLVKKAREAEGQSSKAGKDLGRKDAQWLRKVEAAQEVRLQAC